MAGILVFGSLSDGELAGATLEAVAAAQAVGQTPVQGALIGHDLAAAAGLFARAALSGLFVSDHPQLTPYIAERHAAAAAAIIGRAAPDLVLFPQTAETAEWVPLLAGRLGVPLATGCTGLAFKDGTLIATRPVCGGAVQAEYEVDGPLRFATLAPGAFAPVPTAAACVPIMPVAVPDLVSRVALIEEKPESAAAGPRLKSAKIIVSGGLGLGAKENWHLVEATATALGAAVGATRAVVELGWVPHSQQIGFSGQKVSPDLYLAIGISGAVHHLAGLTGARAIVAINKDQEASIFRVARFGVVGDAKEIVPAFTARVRELRATQG
jgi:electron transfer flavoprotein alpha subunit